MVCITCVLRFKINWKRRFLCQQKEEEKEKTIDEITSKFGKNSVLKASSLLEGSTVKDRNKKIGGHSAWVANGILLMQ